MSMTNRVPQYVFWFVGDVTNEGTAKFKQYLYKCKAEGTDAIAMISGNGGNYSCIGDIAETLKVTKVHLTTVGFAKVASVTAAIFCLGDERVLLHGTTLVVNDISDVTRSIYTKKLSINDEEWEKMLSCNSLRWEVKERDWRRYGFSTIPYSKVVKRIISTYLNDCKCEVPNCFFFCQDFETMQTAEFLDYIYKCASIKRDVFVEITSNGGRINCLEAILDTLRCTKSKLITIGSGMVASCAAVLFLQGDMRSLKAGTKILLHDSRNTFHKDEVWMRKDLWKEFQVLIKLDKRFEELALNKSTIPKEEYRRQLANGKDWIVLEEDWEKYRIVTNTYEEVLETLMSSWK